MYEVRAQSPLNWCDLLAAGRVWPVERTLVAFRAPGGQMHRAYNLWWVQAAVALMVRDKVSGGGGGGGARGVSARVAAPPRRGPGRCGRAVRTPPGLARRAGGKQEAGVGELAQC